MLEEHEEDVDDDLEVWEQSVNEDEDVTMSSITDDEDDDDDDDDDDWKCDYFQCYIIIIPVIIKYCYN